MSRIGLYDGCLIVMQRDIGEFLVIGIKEAMLVVLIRYLSTTYVSI